MGVNKKNTALISGGLTALFIGNAALNLHDLDEQVNKTDALDIVAMSLSTIKGQDISVMDLYQDSTLITDNPEDLGVLCFMMHVHGNYLSDNLQDAFSYSGVFTNFAVGEISQDLLTARKQDVYQAAISRCEQSFDVAAVKTTLKMNGISIN